MEPERAVKHVASAVICILEIDTLANLILLPMNVTGER